jgi:pimeloyl-ACP methyl ester carboxylesterase
VKVGNGMWLVPTERVAMLRAACLVVAACALLAGCATMADPQQLRASVAPYPGEPLPASRDGRARYRQIFCEMAATALDGSVIGCDDLLWRLQDEQAPGTDSPSLPALAQRLQVFVVSGAFSDCREPATVPFEDAIARLDARGVRIRPVMVSGRSSAAHNARQIADAIAGAGIADDDRVVLVGYSKGAVDALQFLVDFPEQARQVAVVLSVAGAIQGSPLAEQGDWWYRTFLQHAFAGTCDPGDGQVLHSLLPSVRKAWLADNPLPSGVAYYSLAAFTTAEHMSHGLKPAWRMLARHDHRNDGQVVAGDAIIPGSTVLGYVNADHWDLAIALEQQMPRLSARTSDRQLPRTALLEAALLYISEQLALAEAAGTAAAGATQQ